MTTNIKCIVKQTYETLIP